MTTRTHAPTGPARRFRDRHSPRLYQSAPRPLLERALVLLVRGLDHLQAWQERERQRLELLALDERMLHDIGITRAEAEREARKPFWRG